MDEKLCVICIDDIQNSNIIEYNHCGKYYIHEKCYNTWKYNNKSSCLICRENIIIDINDTQINNNVSNKKYYLKCCILNTVLVSFGIFLIIILL